MRRSNWYLDNWLKIIWSTTTIIHCTIATHQRWIHLNDRLFEKSIRKMVVLKHQPSETIHTFHCKHSTVKYYFAHWHEQSNKKHGFQAYDLYCSSDKNLESRHKFRARIDELMFTINTFLDTEQVTALHWIDNEVYKQIDCCRIYLFRKHTK